MKCQIFLQETEIDSIHQLVVGATEHVKEGNEDIREVRNVSQNMSILPQIPQMSAIKIFFNPSGY